MSLNLLPSQAKFQMEKIRMVGLSHKILKYFLVVWVMVVLVTVVVLQGQNWWLSQLDKKYQAIVSDYLSSSTEITVSQTIKFRTKLLAKVLSDRFEYSSAFAIVGNVFDPVIKIKDFELKEKKYISMIVKADDKDQMNLIESRIGEINLGAEPGIAKIDITQVEYVVPTGSWEVSMEVYIK